MISKIEIENFKSHKRTELEFDPGVNVIVGPTDSGKSAIIQAIRWVMNNKPAGDSMRSNWGGDTSVTLYLDDNLSAVTRYKSKSRNEYLLLSGEGGKWHTELFKAMKSGIPEEIIKLLNVSEVNLQSQFDRHFLLSNSSGEVASFLNYIAHLDKIDLSLNNLLKWQRENNKDIKVCESDIDEVQELIEEFPDLDTMDHILTKAEDLDESIQEDLKSMDTLTFLVEEMRDCLSEIETEEETLKATDLVDSIIDIVNTQKVLEREQITLDEVLNDLSIIDKKETQTTEKIKELEEQFHGSGLVCPICNQIIK